MLNELGWRSLENRRIDARLIMLFKIIYGYVAIQVPPYFERSQRYTRHMHLLAFWQLHTTATYYQQSFYPALIVLWNRLPSKVGLLEDLDFFHEEVCNPIHCFYPALKIHRFCTNTMSFYHVSLSHFLSPTSFLLPLH